MTIQLTSGQVWQTIEKELFAVLGMVTAKNEARTVGVVYVVRNRKLYIGTSTRAWKARHIARNPHVSLMTMRHPEKARGWAPAGQAVIKETAT